MFFPKRVFFILLGTTRSTEESLFYVYFEPLSTYLIFSRQFTLSNVEGATANHLWFFGMGVISDNIVRIAANQLIFLELLVVFLGHQNDVTYMLWSSIFRNKSSSFEDN